MQNLRYKSEMLKQGVYQNIAVFLFKDMKDTLVVWKSSKHNCYFKFGFFSNYSPFLMSVKKSRD